MATVRKRVDITPDTLDVTIYYGDNGKWLLEQPEVLPIRFHIVGKAMGPARWRPHLIQYKDPLPVQDKRDFNNMMTILRESISNQLNLECTPISKDLFDEVLGED